MRWTERQTVGCEVDRDRLWVVRWTERQAVGCEVDRETDCGL